MEHTRTPISDEQRRLYRAGAWSCPAPPVCTVQWDEDSWIRYILRDGSGLGEQGGSNENK